MPPKVKHVRDEGLRPGDIAELLSALARAERDYARAVAARLRIAPTDLFALGELMSGEPVGVVELGRRLGLGSAGATSLADRLEAAGHLTRGPHPHDRRRVVLSATDHARDDLLSLLQSVSHDSDGLAAELSPSEREIVGRFLRDAVSFYVAHAARLTADS